MNEDAPAVLAGRTWRWWGVLRLVLVLLWLLGAATTWWSAPRKQSYDQARADVAAGRVTAYQWGDRWDGDGPRSWFGAAALKSSGTLGPLFVWRTADGRTHWIDTANVGQVTTTGAVDETSYSGQGAVGIAQDIRAAGLEDRSGDVESLGPLLTWIGIVLTVVFLGVLVAGPAPTLGTRWFWFWLVYIAPLGLGLLFWLARDHPWSHSTAPAASSGGAKQRDRGILGLGIGLLATILVSVLLAVLHAVLGDRWVPRPDA